MATNNGEWLKVDRAGLAKILRRKGIEFAVFELIQNAWDEKGVTTVDVTLEPAQERGYAKLTISDNAPNGFANLAHAYTLFAESEKKGNAEQRGRFNLGEKLVLALCKWAVICSTKGTIVFDDKGRSKMRTKRESGTIFNALVRMTRAEVLAATMAVEQLIPPHGIVTIFNGATLKEPVVKTEFTASLPTEIGDEDGNLHGATRTGTVRVYPVAEGDTARIYEMGIPVVEHDCAFHVDVQQKVPLTLDRENVSPKFLRAMRTAVFNHTHQLVTREQATHEWAQTAIENPKVSATAVEDYMAKRFGEQRVSYDPSDPEANHKAVANGYTLVHGSMLSREAWENVRLSDAIRPAGQMFPTRSESRVPWERAEMTDGMHAVAQYARQFARATINKGLLVSFGKQASNEAAAYLRCSDGASKLTFNATNLGNDWFDLEKNRQAIDDLLIHELGHEYSSNHLSAEYYDALTSIGARAIQAARENKL